MISGKAKNPFEKCRQSIVFNCAPKYNVNNLKCLLGKLKLSKNIKTLKLSKFKAQMFADNKKNLNMKITPSSTLKLNRSNTKETSNSPKSRNSDKIERNITDYY